MNYLTKIVDNTIEFFKYILKKIICIVFVLGTVAAIIFLLLHFSNIENPNEVESQQIYIKNISLDNWGTIITIAGLLITAIWSMYQYTKSRAIRQQEKASEIAQIFSNNLIEKTGLISDVLMQNREIQKMVHKINNSGKLSQFTTLEIQNILNDTKCFDKFNKIIKSKRTQSRYNDLLSTRYNESEKSNFNSYFPLLVENTLNQLEAICINISSEAAGSQFIYDSLHQTFLYTVEVLSIKISSNNNNNVDKYYTNIIDVYNMWNIQKEKDIKKLKKTQKKIDRLSNKADKEINKLLNKKKGKTV